MTKLAMPFGNPSTYPNHSGVDFAQKSGTSVRASAGGIVIAQGFSPVTRLNPRAAGHWLTVGYDGGPRVFMCHFRDRTGTPGNGRRFEALQHLAPVGSTGFSTGPHLHLAIDGQPGYANVWRYFDALRVIGSPEPAGDRNPSTPTLPKEAPDMPITYRFTDTRAQGIVVSLAPGMKIVAASEQQATAWAKETGGFRDRTAQEMRDVFQQNSIPLNLIEPDLLASWTRDGDVIDIVTDYRERLDEVGDHAP